MMQRDYIICLMRLGNQLHLLISQLEQVISNEDEANLNYRNYP